MSNHSSVWIIIDIWDQNTTLQLSDRTSYYSNFITLLLTIHLIFHLTDTINLLTTEFSPVHYFSSDTTLLLLNKNQPTGIGLHPCPCSSLTCQLVFLIVHQLKLQLSIIKCFGILHSSNQTPVYNSKNFTICETYSVSKKSEIFLYLLWSNVTYIIRDYN